MIYRSHLLALSLTAALTSACTGSSPKLEVLLTDAPGDWDQLLVEISRVEISGADGQQVLVEQPRTFDLLTLQNDVTAALGGATLVAGHYNQLRLVVDQARAVTGEITEDLEIASGAQTGIKINLDSDFEDGLVYTIVLDFDAARSVKQTGQGLLMTPVIEVKSITSAPAVEPEREEPQP